MASRNPAGPPTRRAKFFSAANYPANLLTAPPRSSISPHPKALCRQLPPPTCTFRVKCPRAGKPSYLYHPTKVARDRPRPARPR